MKKETWKVIASLKKMKLRKNYAVSNLGRIKSFVKHPDKDGEVVGKSVTEGYYMLKLKPYGGKKNLNILVHRLVAEHWIKKPSAQHKNVIHINHSKLDNRASNLKWTTRTEMYAHWNKSPVVLKQRKKMILEAKRSKPVDGEKLTIANVKKIKMMLFKSKKKYTLNQIAKMYKVSDMQVHRIKTGENWSKVKV